MFESGYSKLLTGIDRLIEREPFFGYLMYGLDLVERKANPEKGISRMGTDGYVLVYDPAFIKSLPNDHLVGVLAHEALHIALRHPTRRGDRDDLLWQVACDCVVDMILERHNYKLPDDRIRHTVYQTRDDETAEDVYERLKKMSDNGGGPKPQDMPQWGTSADAGTEKKPGDEDGDQPGEGYAHKPTPNDEAEIEKAIIAASELAKEQGKLPAEIKALIDEMFVTTRDWRDMVRKFLNGGEERVPTWSRPNRRWISQDIYLPGPTKYGPGEIVIGIDTSGSIDDKLLAKFLAEIRKINQDLMPDKTHVVVCDARVHWTESFGPYEDIEVKVMGRGGTDFRPVFDWVDKNGLNPKALIYFTDMYGAFPDRPPPYPTMWVRWPGGGASPGWGEVVDMP